VPLAAASTAVAGAQGPPSAPTGVSAACVSTIGASIKVTWSGVSLATSYTVLDSTTSATFGFGTIASGVTGTSWTSGNLATGTYWFEVMAFIGVNWAGPPSTATSQHTIAVLACL
jgi:pectate lyase